MKSKTVQLLAKGGKMRLVVSEDANGKSIITRSAVNGGTRFVYPHPFEHHSKAVKRARALADSPEKLSAIVWNQQTNAANAANAAKAA